MLRHQPRPIWWSGGKVASVQGVTLGLILLIAAGLRFANLGGLSLWYDEVVSMRIARGHPDPTSLLKQLHELDATRRLCIRWCFTGGFRSSARQTHLGTRPWRAVCGVLAVLLVYQIAREVFASESTGLAAAWLSAVSPLLVLYSREIRMYAWLTMLTCLAWWLVLRLRQGSGMGVGSPMF